MGTSSCACGWPDLFLPSVEDFKARMDHLVETLKAQPRAEGVEEVMIPGEPESKAEEERSGSGVPLQADVVESLKAEGEALGLAFPQPVA